MALRRDWPRGASHICCSAKGNLHQGSPLSLAILLIISPLSSSLSFAPLLLSSEHQDRRFQLERPNDEEQRFSGKFYHTRYHKRFFKTTNRVIAYEYCPTRPYGDDKYIFSSRNKYEHSHVPFPLWWSSGTELV